jgi:hypothetical protein
MLKFILVRVSEILRATHFISGKVTRRGLSLADPKEVDSKSSNQSMKPTAKGAKRPLRC